MPVISTLYVELKLQADNFNNAIKAAQKEAKEFEKTIKPSKEALQDMGTAMTAVGGVILGTMIAATKATADYADHINDLSKMTGASTENLSKWGFAAEQSGSSLDGVSVGLKFLSKNMELATAGNKEQIKAFQAAGISAKDLAEAHGDVNRILPKLADSFHNAEDGAGKTAVALSLLGKSGTELIPMLDEGSAGLEHWGQVAEQAGRVVSAEAGAAADEFNDKLGILEGSLAGAAGTIGETLMPPLTEFITQATAAVVQVREWADAHPGLIKVIAGAAAALTGTGGLLLGLSGVLTVLPKVTAAFGLMTGPVGLTVAGIAALAAGIIYFRKEIEIGLLAAFATVLTGFEKFLDATSSVARAVGADGLADKLSSAKFSLEEYRRGLDASVASGMAQYMTIAKTAGQLQAEETARQQATVTTAKHTIELAKNTTEQDAQAKKLHEIITSNQAKMLNYSDDIQKQMTSSIALITSRYEALNNLVEKIQAKNYGVLQSEIEKENKLHSDSINYASDLYEKSLKEQSDVLAQQLKTIDDGNRANVEFLKKSIDSVKQAAGAIFDDMFLKGQNVFSSLGNLLKGGALSLGRTIFQDIVGELFGPITAQFEAFFTGLVESTGIKTFISGLGSKIGGVLSGILGGGGGDAASAAVGGAANVAGGAASAAGGIAGAAGSIFTGLIGGIAGGIISGLGSFLGSMRLEGTMNAVEANTRFTYIELKDLIDQIMWPIKGVIDFMGTEAGTMVNQLDAIWVSLEGIRNSGGMGVMPSAIPVSAAPAVASPAPQQTVLSSPAPTVYNTIHINNPTGDGTQIANDFLSAVEQNGDIRRQFRDMFGRPI